MTGHISVLPRLGDKFPDKNDIFSVYRREQKKTPNDEPSIIVNEARISRWQKS